MDQFYRQRYLQNFAKWSGIGSDLISSPAHLSGPASTIELELIHKRSKPFLLKVNHPHRRVS